MPGANMIHVILLGDSVFDNAAYVGNDPDVRRQLAGTLSPGSKVTLLARDGDVIAEIGSQLRRLPNDATHLVISIGGNDALRASAVLESGAASVADALARIDAIADGFGEAYGAMLNEVTRIAALPIAICTIYDPRYAEAARRKLATAALTLLNDKIMRHAVARRLTLIDLRLTCDEDRDFANPIEPSANGGAKIAQAISKFVRAEPAQTAIFTHK
jgi:lysophospholipase L1-like esterase